MRNWTRADLLRPNIAERMVPGQRKQWKIETTGERTNRIDNKTHKQVLHEIVAWLSVHVPPIVCAYGRMDKKSTITEGWPDVTFAKPDKVGRAYPCAAEVKVGRDNLSDAQIDCHCRMRANGWYVRVVGSRDEFIRFYKSVGT